LSRAHAAVPVEARVLIVSLLNLAHRLFATVGLSSGHAEVVLDGRVYRVRLSERA
jgi:hypothetical protein